MRGAGCTGCSFSCSKVLVVEALALDGAAVVVSRPFSREARSARWWLLRPPSGLGRSFKSAALLCRCNTKGLGLASVVAAVEEECCSERFPQTLFCRSARRAARSIQGFMIAEACAVAFRCRSCCCVCCCCCWSWMWVSWWSVSAGGSSSSSIIIPWLSMVASSHSPALGGGRVRQLATTILFGDDDEYEVDPHCGSGGGGGKANSIGTATRATGGRSLYSSWACCSAGLGTSLRDEGILVVVLSVLLL